MSRRFAATRNLRSGVLLEVSVFVTEVPDNQASRSPATSLPPSGSDFIEDFTRNQRRLYLFILVQVPNPVDAEEVLQETNVVVWRKCQQFQPGSNFFAWACQIATFEVLKYRERRHRDRLYFSDEFVQQIAEEALENTDMLEQRRKALAHCLGKLRPRDRALVEQRYAPGNNGKGLAEVLGRPVNSVYQSLGRIRKSLLECITRRLTAEAG